MVRVIYSSKRKTTFIPPVNPKIAIRIQKHLLELGDYETHSRWDVVCWWVPTMARTFGCFGWPEMVCITTGGVFSSGEVCSLPTLGQLAYKKVDANWTIWNLLRMWKQQHVFSRHVFDFFFVAFEIWRLQIQSDFTFDWKVRIFERRHVALPRIMPQIIPTNHTTNHTMTV